ncbi:MAG: hypothetical protein Q8M57_11920 [Nitrosomonas sp.]|uniref:hypothetical protein n=1 Tax=Nitrosomonas sp. TaxID=42353 RepID=UPI0027363DE3|nr:hypothetical protein [Nitrosomonas sp.]MDP3281733.1 hypothetical protein [Nitrosomonas sp.]
MRLFRILAECREGGENLQDYKLVLICGLNSENKMEDGEWLGYLKNERTYYPFILKDKACFYGGEEHEYEPTNLPEKIIEKGCFFTISNGPRDIETWESTYQITSCYELV